jgi:hypothetical protein
VPRDLDVQLLEAVAVRRARLREALLAAVRLSRPGEPVSAAVAAGCAVLGLCVVARSTCGARR